MSRLGSELKKISKEKVGDNLLMNIDKLECIFTTHGGLKLLHF
jgi:hypothetical protein